MRRECHCVNINDIDVSLRLPSYAPFESPMLPVGVQLNTRAVRPRLKALVRQGWFKE